MNDPEEIIHGTLTNSVAHSFVQNVLQQILQIHYMTADKIFILKKKLFLSTHTQKHLLFFSDET